MATVNSRSSRVREKLPPAPGPAKAPRRFRRAGWGLFGVFLAFVAMAPTILAQTAFMNWALASFLPVNGRLTAGSASCGWFSPLSLSDVELRDEAGEPCAIVDSIATEINVWSLIFNRSQLGRVQVTHPAVHLVLREKGSNLEDVLAPLLDRERPTTAPKMDLEVIDGVLTVDDTVADRRFKVEELAIGLQLEPSAPLACHVAGKLPSEDEDASFDLKFQLDRNAAQSGQALPPGELKGRLARVPLNLVEPLVRRALAGARISGRLTSDLDCVWGAAEGQQRTRLQGETTITDFSLTADALAGDELRLARIEAPLDIQEQADELVINKLLVQCELGQAALVGTVRLADLEPGKFAAAVTRQNCKLEGHVDLVRLAHALPGTLRIREGTQITSGQLQLKLESDGARLPHWSGQLTGTELAAISNGQQVRWERPLVVNFAAHDSTSGVVVDQLRADSSFLQANIAGTPRQLSGAADFDLAQLWTELDRFADLADLQLTGRGHLDLALSRSPQDELHADATLTTDNMRLLAAGGRPWEARRLVARFTAQGQYAESRLARIDAAKLAVDADSQHLGIELAEAVADLNAARWPLVVDWQGQLADAEAQLAPWMPADWRFAGAGTIQGEVVLSKGAVECRGSRVSVEQFQAAGPGIAIAEPLVELKLAGRWDRAGQRAEVTTADLSAGALNLQVRDAAWAVSEQGKPTVSGNLNYRADLAQLDRWLHSASARPSWQIAGLASGRADITQRDGSLSATLESAVERLVVTDLAASWARPPRGGAPAAPSQWREARLALSARGHYESATDQLTINLAELASEAVNCQLKGSIAELTTIAQLDVDGKLDLDWPRLAPVYRQYLGPDAKIEGHESRAFAIRGPWPANGQPVGAALARLTADAGIGWQSADIYGLQIGKGELGVKLADGKAQVRPIDLAVGKGRLTLAPQVVLAPEPGEVQLARGPLARDLEISPEVCARGLRYIAPVLNDVAVAEGQFSIDLEGGRVPLADPRAADVAGKFTVHSVHVRPGPLAAEIIAIGRQIEALAKARPAAAQKQDTLLDIDNQAVEFRVVQGRVYHRDMEVKIGDVPIHTHGSVGLDESLALAIEVTVQDSWIERDSPLSFLKGQTFQLPVSGTLQKPEVDKRALEKVAGQAAKGAVRGVLENQLNKQLEKLLPSPR